MDKNLNDLRKEIDEIDSKIIALLKKRLEIIKIIKDYKEKNNIPILDNNREKEILSNIKKNIEDEKDLVFYSHIYETILKESKDIQKGSIN